MKLEKQVITLEQAKELNSLGVKSQTYFYWVEFEDGIFALCREGSKYEESNEIMWMIVGETPPEIQEAIDDECCNATGMVYPAYSVAELLKMLPFIIRHDDNDYFMNFGHGSKGYRVIYETNKLGLIFNLDDELDREKKALFGTFRSGKYAAQVLGEYLRMLLAHGDGVVDMQKLHDRVSN